MTSRCNSVGLTGRSIRRRGASALLAVCACMLALAGAPPEALTRSVLTDVDGHLQGSPQPDDIALVAIQRQAQ